MPICSKIKDAILRVVSEFENKTEDHEQLKNPLAHLLNKPLNQDTNLSLTYPFA